MKMLRIFLVVTSVILMAGVAQADVLITFDTGTQDAWNATWVPTHQAVVPVSAGGGWTLGSTVALDFNSMEGGIYEPEMQAIVNSGLGRVSFDMWTETASFVPDAGAWYQFLVAGNSDGVAGWTQHQLNDEWRNPGEPGASLINVDMSAADMGWEPGDAWHQIHFGTNSDGAQGIYYFVDNVRVYQIPEPGTLALLGLGLIGAAIRRRR